MADYFIRTKLRTKIDYFCIVMAELLKNVYSPQFIALLSSYLEKELPVFDKKTFEAKIFSSEWKEFELKARMTHIASVLKEFLDSDYKKSCAQIVSLIALHRRIHPNGFNFEFMFLPEYIRLYGLEDYEISIKAIEQVTQFTSCEFVVRYFLNAYPEKMVQQMQDWTTHPHHYVRRLASEGMRTKLPWAIKVLYLNQNPKEIFWILEKLANDESEWVRKSVSNSLNDLSKDFPTDTIAFTKKWLNHSKEVNSLLKHGNRTLLKAGNMEVMNLFGFANDINFTLHKFEVKEQQVAIGGELNFDFALELDAEQETTLRLEYRLYFLRANATHYAKTFKIKEQSITQKTKVEIQKTHNFKVITTRKYYPGEHFVSLIVNGKELEKNAFIIN